MFNDEKVLSIIAAYKECFPKRWDDERYKWEAIWHFQKNWDVNAENFLDMFMRATDKAYNLLANMDNYPRDMIKLFAMADSEAALSNSKCNHYISLASISGQILYLQIFSSARSCQCGR